MSEPIESRAYPIVRPLTLAQVLEITGRSERTVERWTQQGLLTRYELTHPREVVFMEDEVLDIESRKSRAAVENRERIRRRGGRPATVRAGERARLDEASGDAA